MNKVKSITVTALMAAILFAVQIILSGLPNIELVSLLVILFTIAFPKNIWGALAVFCVLEGVFYGFGTWWLMYLYVWPMLALTAYFFRKNNSPFFWCVVNGTFGLMFGLLCAFSYLPIGGIPMMLSWWVSGIPFDIVHGISNAVTALVLFKPLYSALEYIARELKK